MIPVQYDLSTVMIPVRYDLGILGHGGIHGHGGYFDMGDTWTWGIGDHKGYIR